MPGNGACEHDEIGHPYRVIAQLPTRHEHEFSRCRDGIGETISSKRARWNEVDSIRMVSEWSSAA
jgi:hypothetical protein